MTVTTHDDDPALDPASMLSLLQLEQDRVPRRLARQIPWIFTAWGIAWFFGYGMLWLIDGARPAVAMPLPVSVSFFIVLLLGAIIVSTIIGSRAGRGIRPTREAVFTGTVYGITGSAGFLAMYVFAFALSANGMDPDLEPIFFPTAMGIVIAVMYLVGGAIWHTTFYIVMGGAILIVSLAAPFLGYPNHYLVFAIAGGGVFFAGAISTALYIRGGRDALVVR
ncbi:MAG: hypothetical protein ACRCSP_07385 [Rhodoglobus sp.]